MWGTDATRFYTEQDGWCWFFGAIDHYCDDIVGWHVAKRGDRWAALEPLRQGAREIFGGFHKDVARGVTIRCDWGPQYIADAWITEVKWLGMTIMPSYVGEPEWVGAHPHGGAIPYLAERLDRGYRAFADCRQHIGRPPSEYLSTFYYDTVNFNPAALRLALDFAGEDRIVAGSDYPHQIGSIPLMLETIRGYDGPAPLKEKIFSRNAADLLGL